MPTRAPLTVRLATPDIEQAFDVRDLQFTKSWRGGHKDLSVTLPEPLTSRHPMLSPFAKLRVDDNRCARTIWDGYLDLPGQTRGDAGDVWQIGATGGYARLSDGRKPYVVIDRNFAGWEFSQATKGAMSGQQGAHPDNEDVDTLLLMWPEGLAVTDGAYVSMRYYPISDAGQLIGGFSVTHDDSGSTPNNRFQFGVAIMGTLGSLVLARDRVCDTVPDTTNGSAGSEFTGARDVAVVRRYRDNGGATNLASDGWCAVTAVRVTARLHDINGDQILGAGTYANDYVVAADVVTDMLTHFDPPIDRNAVTIEDVFTHQIDHLAYEDPTTMQTVLDDLALMHPTMVWEVLETNATGKHRFAMRQVSSDPRYLATADDGWESPGGEDDLRNEVTVSFRNRKGKKTARSYTAAVPELDQWGIVRNAELINLADDLGSPVNADRIGAKVLEQVSRSSDDGTLTVARPIRDLWTGRDVYPWEIEPGYRIRIEDVDVDPRPITEVAYRDSDASATVTVGEPALSTDEIVAMYSKRRKRRG